jgi:hypothetical protein
MNDPYGAPVAPAAKVPGTGRLVVYIVAALVGWVVPVAIGFGLVGLSMRGVEWHSLVVRQVGSVDLAAGEYDVYDTPSTRQARLVIRTPSGEELPQRPLDNGRGYKVGSRTYQARARVTIPADGTYLLDAVPEAPSASGVMALGPTGESRMRAIAFAGGGVALGLVNFVVCTTLAVLTLRKRARIRRARA